MPECCSSAHNLNIVRDELRRAEDTIRQQTIELNELRDFKKLVMALTAQLPATKTPR